MTLTKGHFSAVCQHFQKAFLKLHGKFQPDFIRSLQLTGERKFIFGLGHMTNVAVVPIYGKNLKIFYSITTQPIALKLGMQHFLNLVLQSLYKC